MNSKRAIAQLLQHLSAIGVTHLPKVELPKLTTGSDRNSVQVRQPNPSAANPSAAKSPAAVPVRSAIRPVSDSLRREESGNSRSVLDPGLGLAGPNRAGGMFLSSAELQTDSAIVPPVLTEVLMLMKDHPSTAAQKSDALCSLAGIVAKCSRCTELASTRTQTVFGVGRPDARIMLIGEAPGADEDACGEPFVGRAGQLLSKILEASQLKREDLYICNILRCRPPGNRNPLPQEAANCREYLDAQIQIVRPEYIICWGAVAAQNLLNEKRAIGKLRGQFHEYRGARVMCTYHPSYLLRYPTAKTQVWEDMKFFMKELGIEPIT